MATELAYNIVSPECRGQGLGARMFDLRIARAANIQRNNDPIVLFTMSRGAHLDDGRGKQVFAYLLEQEKNMNGVMVDGRTNISGLRIPVREIRRKLNLPAEFNFEQVHNDSLPIVKLANRSGMIQIGLFKDLSPLFATIIN